MKRRRPPRILVGPYEVAGFYRNLCEGFRKLGVDYDFITYGDDARGYGGETRRPWLVRGIRWGLDRRRQHEGHAVRFIYSAVVSFLGLAWTLQAAFRYDAFVFGYGHSLMRSNIDLSILRILGRVVVSNLGHGSEARPSYIGGYLRGRAGERPSLSYIRDRARWSSELVARHTHRASVVVGAPFTTSQFGLGRMANFLALGIPYSDRDQPEHMEGSDRPMPGSASRPVRILHSPSHPFAKGTALITAAVERLQERGHSIDFVTVQGRPFSEVLAEIKRCDFVVDQAFSDTPLAGFAAEAGWYGKPAVVGGYGLDRLMRWAPREMWPPSMICKPEDLELAIERLVTDEPLRERLGSEVMSFMRTRWSAEQVARRYLVLIAGEVPEDWWFDPREVVYLEGSGQPADESRRQVRDLLSAFGEDSLALDGRPDLRRAFIDFAALSRPG